MRYIITLTLLLQSLIACTQINQIDSVELVQIIETNIDTLMSEFKVPGAVISVVKDGKLFYTAGIGKENIEDDKSIDPERSQFRVASITKTFTAIAILQLVEDGKLDLHADIRTYLPEGQYPWDAEESFTIHHLLTHTTGMETSEFRISQAAVDAKSLDVMIKTSICDQIFTPGEVFYYSNRGYGILGLIIEKLSGQKYEDYIQEHILTPMGMSNSTVYQHTEDHPIQQPVQPYYWDGEFKKRDRLFLVNPAASNLNTTGADMAKFMIAMLDSAQVEGHRIISKQSYELMTKKQYAPAMDFESMGYGVMIENFKGQSGYHHGGGIDGFGSFYNFFPDLDLGIFMSESGGQENAGYAFSVIYSILDTLIMDYKETFTKVPTEVAIRQAEKYEGRYQLTTVTKSTFERGQMLFGLDEPIVEHIGDGILTYAGKPYEPIDNNTYKIVDGRRKIGFDIDANGVPTYMSQRLYWTYEKITWIESATALRLGLGIALVLLFISLIIRPLVLRKKHQRSINWRSIVTASFGLMTVGFGLLLIGYTFNIELTRGTPLVYKAGLVMTTLGAGLFALYPLEIISQIKNLSRKELTWKVITLTAMILLIICYWRVNLIGLNYY